MAFTNGFSNGYSTGFAVALPVSSVLDDIAVDAQTDTLTGQSPSDVKMPPILIGGIYRWPVASVDNVIIRSHVGAVIVTAPPGIYKIASSVMGDVVPNLTIAPGKIMGRARWTPTKSGVLTVTGGILDELGIILHAPYTVINDLDYR